LVIDEAGREGGRIGLSAVKKLDFLLREAGDGGIWESVSMVLSDNEDTVSLFGPGVSGS